jgi:hypothetical protein
MTDRKARDFSSHPAAISDGNGPADSASSFLSSSRWFLRRPLAVFFLFLLSVGCAGYFYSKAELIATIQQAAEKLLALLDNVFIWSQSQSGRLEYAPCQHPVLPSIKETFSLFALIGQPGAVVK